MSANGQGVLLGLAAFAAFSTHDVVIKQLGAAYSPFQIVFFTALLSFPAITLILIREREPATLRPVHPWWMALRSTSGAISGLCAFYALGILPLSQFYAFIFTSPLLITLMAIPILGETVRLRRGLAVAMGLVGVVIVVRPGAVPLTDGHLAAFGAALAGSLAAIVVRKIGKSERGVVMVLYPMMTNLAVAAVVLPFVYVPVPLADFGLLVVDAALVLLAMGLLVAAYSRAEAILVAPMQYSQIVWAVLFGILLFGEYPEWQTYAGMAVIVLSGLYILKREATGDVSRNTPVLETRTRPGHGLTLRVGHFLRREDRTP